MLFKNSQASMPLYIFDRSNITLTKSKITSIVPSHLDVKMSGKMVVDITTLIDNKPLTYTIDDSLSVAYFGTTALSLDLDSILREVETMKCSSEQAIQDIDRHKETVTKCHQLLLEHNPQLKERAAIDQRFSAIDKKIDSLADSVHKFIEAFNK